MVNMVNIMPPKHHHVKTCHCEHASIKLKVFISTASQEVYMIHCIVLIGKKWYDNYIILISFCNFIKEIKSDGRALIQ